MKDSERIAHRLAELEKLGFERSDCEDVRTASERTDAGAWKVAGARPAMGTLVSITVVDRSERRAQEAIGRAFEEMDRLIAILNRFDESSALSCLNREGRLYDTPPELACVVEKSLRYHGISGGLFDITVRPLVDLFREKLGEPERREPTDAEIREALRRIGAGSVEMAARTIAFRREGMSVTLDGIAKGFIVDGIAGVLSKHRVRNYLINAGGDIRTCGKREDRGPWLVAVQDPARRGAYPDVLPMTKGAVATSGGYEIYFDRERMYHHIVDSATGRSPNLHTSVTVRAPTAMAADALATTLFLMEPLEGLRLVGRLNGCECFIIDREGGPLHSGGWSR